MNGSFDILKRLTGPAFIVCIIVLSLVTLVSVPQGHASLFGPVEEGGIKIGDRLGTEGLNLPSGPALDQALKEANQELKKMHDQAADQALKEGSQEGTQPPGEAANQASGGSAAWWPGDWIILIVPVGAAALAYPLLIKRRRARMIEKSKTMERSDRRGRARAIAEETKTIERYPYATFPSKVAIGDTKALRVVIKAIKPEPNQTSTMSRAYTGIQISSEDKKQVSILIYVDLDSVDPYFDIQGDDKKYVTISLGENDSNPVIFDLKAKKEGSTNILLDFYLVGGNHLGQLKLSTTVVSTSIQTDPSPSIAQYTGLMKDLISDSSNVTLIIKQEQRRKRYAVTFSSEKYGIIEAGYIPLENPESKFRYIFEDEEIENTNLLPDEIEEIMSNKGKNLYEEIVPPELKKLYWETRDNIKSIRVYSQEPWIPWEIIKPWRGPEEDKFFCERFIFSRWFVGTKIEKKEEIKKVKVVVPLDIRLKNTLDEHYWLKKFFASKGVDTSEASTYDQVKDLLRNEGYDLIHFSGHGRHADGMPLYSVIELEGGRTIRPEDISGMSTKFGLSHPIVFLNSCQSGMQGFSLTGIQSWAKKFTGAGASAFIGTLWSVTDDTAFKFVQELYDRLANGIPLDRAMKEARSKCKQNGDPSWLAYTLFCGSPDMQLSFVTESNKNQMTQLNK